MAFKSLLIVAAATCSVGSALYTSNPPWITPRNLAIRQLQPGSTCGADQPIISAPHKNIWKGLTNDETAAVTALLHQNSTGLNLTAANKATSWDNRIIIVDLLAPNKSDVLPFLTNRTAAPARYARATMMFGATLQPYLQEYVVGPLPVTNQTKVQLLEFLFNNEGKGKIKIDNADDDTVGNFLQTVGLSVADITQTLWNGTLNSSLGLTQISPPWREDGKLIIWSGFVNNPTSTFDTMTLLPLGLYYGADVTGRDPSKWKVIGWFYNNKFYATADEFRAASKSANFTKLPANIDGQWGWTDKQGEPMTFDDLPPPAPVAQGHQRFSVDPAENYVSWMDFSFYVSFNRNNGLRLFDINYKGKRILYELGLQEALAHYAGNDPVQSGTIYFDSGPGMGPSVVSLVDGYDCPTYSTYMNATYQGAETSYTQPNAICMFEFDHGYPIQRHSTRGYTSVTKNIAFTLRSISTVGNYDYMFSYNFYADGSMEVDVRASGYIQSGFYANNEDYGFKIHDSLSGSMHDHVLTYKADFDILGEKNSLLKAEFVPASVEYPWSNGKKRNTMKVNKSMIGSENDSKLNWAPNNAAMYAIVNKDAKNKFGEYPGYRIAPATANAIYLTVENSSNALNTVNFATHHFYVTQQKDTEAECAHPYNELHPAEPLVDFAKFFDGESLDQQDLVVWFNLGMHHLPHTGDLPNTMFTTAHSALTIEPQNYLLNDPSRATTQQVRINYDDNNKVTAVQTFGAHNASCAVNASQFQPNLWRDMGTSSVDKYPYNPLDPHNGTRLSFAPR